MTGREAHEIINEAVSKGRMFTVPFTAINEAMGVWLRSIERDEAAAKAAKPDPIKRGVPVSHSEPDTEKESTAPQTPKKPTTRKGRKK